MDNKTVCYHRHILRLPFFVKKAYEKMKTFSFLEKNHYVHPSYFQIFPTFKIFWYTKKNFLIREEKTLLRNNTIWYAFYSKFASFIHFEKNQVFSGKPIYFFQKKHKFWTFWEISLFQSHSTANFLKFGKNFTFSNVTILPMLVCWRERNWQTSG